MEPDIFIEDPRWEALDLAALTQRALSVTLARLDMPGEDVELSLLACNDARISVLNAEFRGKPQPTNVLSWPAQDLTPPDRPAPDPFGTLTLGDIALSYDTCDREAAEQGKSLADHVTHLIVHATLHLLGYDHERDTDATLMEGLETDILGKMGLADPYTER